MKNEEIEDKKWTKWKINDKYIKQTNAHTNEPMNKWISEQKIKHSISLKECK